MQFQTHFQSAVSLAFLWMVTMFTCPQVMGQGGGCPSCPPMIIYFQSTTPASCGECDGSFNLCVVGQSPFTYQWTGPNGFTAVTEDISNLCPGTYTVVVTDDFGNTKTISGTIVEDCYCTLWGDVQWTPITCDGPGTATAQGYDGQPPYKYKWDNGVMNQTISIDQPGWHSVTITDSGIGNCESIHYVYFDAPGADVNVTASPSVICQGSSSILKAFVSGTGPFTYTWKNGGTTIGTTQQITVTPTTTTIYTVNIVDALGCETSTNVIVSVNTVPVVSINGPTNLCAGQTTTLNASGTPGANYSWSSGQTGASIVVNPGTSTTYTVTATKGGCTGSDNHTITVNSTTDTLVFGQPKYICGDSTYSFVGYDTTITANCVRQILVYNVFVVPFPTFTGNVNNVTCFGNNNGSIIINTIDSVDIWWSNGFDTKSITNLSPGIYSVTVTTAAGCETTTTFTVTQPLPLTLETTIQNPTCFGSTNGLLDVQSEGGTAPYQYNWSTGSQDHLLQNLTADTYGVIVTDANGCQTGTSFQLTQSDSISLTATLQPTSCEGLPSGAIDLTATGGNGSFTYSWSDFNNQEDRTNLLGGTYGVTVTDGNGCKADSVFNIKENGCSVWFTHDQLWIVIGRCGELPTFDFTVTISDVSGKVVKTFEDTAIDGYYNNWFNVSDLAPGVYAVTVIGANNEVRHGSRFVKP